MEKVAKRAAWGAAAFMSASILFHGDGMAIVCAINAFSMVYLMVRCWK